MPEIQPRKEENVVEDQRLRMNLAKQGDHQHKAKLNSLEWVFGFGFVGGGGCDIAGWQGQISAQCLGWADSSGLSLSHSGLTWVILPGIKDIKAPLTSGARKDDLLPQKGTTGSLGKIRPVSRHLMSILDLLFPPRFNSNFSCVRLPLSFRPETP